jgi:hypothetical protein
MTTAISFTNETSLYDIRETFFTVALNTNSPMKLCFRYFLKSHSVNILNIERNTFTDVNLKHLVAKGRADLGS